MKHASREIPQVQLTLAVPMSPVEKRRIDTRARKLLSKHHQEFRSALMHIYVKSANTKIGVSANLFTDNGRYHAYAEAWNVHQALETAMSALHVQILKHFDRHEHFRTVLHA